MSPVIDAHQHFWTYGTYQTSWMEVPPYAGDPAFQPLRLEVLGRRAADARQRLAGANLRGGYSKVWRETTRALAGLSREECDRILGGTAIAFYRLPGLC